MSDRNQDVPAPLREPVPRTLEGSASYLAKARLSYRIGMGAAVAFSLPFMITIVSDKPNLDKLIGGLLGIALAWILPPVLFLRFRMRHLARLWREGVVVRGRVERIFRGPRPVAATGDGQAFISFSTPGGHERIGHFWAKVGAGELEVGASVPVLCLDEIEHRAGLCAPGSLNVGRVSPRS